MNSSANDVKANILVVDDMPENLRLLTEILTNVGYTARPVRDGKLALASAKASPPDLILLDIMMPTLSGYEVCQQLKADERTREIPVIFISALHDVNDKVKGFEMGGVDYITKPFYKDEVLARVRTHLENRNLQRALQKKNCRLQQEIRERERAEEALQSHNRELLLLNQMYQSLQMCENEKQTYAVLEEVGQQMFPEDSGCVYMLHGARSEPKIEAFWGERPAEGSIFQEYQALPEGKMYVIEHPRSKPLFFYLRSAQDEGYLCVFRNDYGDTLGILLLHFKQGEQDDADEKDIKLRESKQLLATRIAEQYSLFLVNLRLRLELKRQVIRDPLTGLYNRRHMEAALEREAQRAKRTKSSIGIIMVDVDHFKHFNDQYGHEAGDFVLHELGRLMQENIRGGDIACRYGGEEFLLILPDTSLEVTLQRAEELLYNVRAFRMAYQQTHFLITISMGIAEFPLHGINVQEVVNAADMALYKAKKNGRDQVAVIEELSHGAS